MPRWITRHGSKRTAFQYRDPSGNPVRDPRVLERVDALRIPPGWNSVHVAVSERAAIQARTFRAFETYLVVTLVYLGLSIGVRRLLLWFGQRKLSVEAT